MMNKRSEAMKKRWQNADFRAKMSGENNPMKRPEVRAHYTETVNRPEIRAKFSDSAKKTWSRPEYRSKVSESMKRVMNRPEVRSEISKNNPMKRAEVRDKRRATMERPESKVLVSESIKKAWSRPEVWAKHTRENNYGWKGGTSFLPYCPKFNHSRKEQVRNDYERVCANCGRSELVQSERLCVHHVDGDKMQGCKESEWFGLGGRWFLVPLCRSCHRKRLEMDLYSVGKFWLAELSRRYWERRVVL